MGDTASTDICFAGDGGNDRKPPAREPPAKRAKTEGGGGADDGESEADDGESEPSSNNNEQSPAEEEHSVSRGEIEQFIKVLGDDYDPEDKSVCNFPDPTVPFIVQRTDVTLDNPTIVEAVRKAIYRSRQLNNLFPNLFNQNLLLIVKVNPATMRVFEVTRVDALTYTGIMSTWGETIARLTFWNANLRQTTPRGFYYKYEKKSHLDTGLYYDQDQSNHHIRRASDFVCAPRIAIAFMSQSDSYFRGPKGTTVTRKEFQNTIYHQVDTYDKNLDDLFYVITAEWQKEYHGMIEPREINLDNVKCLALIEDMLTYMDSNDELVDNGCIAVYTSGIPSSNTIWFVRAIMVRKDILIPIISDMDLGGE